MYHVPHLIHVFLSVYEKGLLNFVSERIKLVDGIKNTRLTFQTSKTKINRPQTSELKSISKLQLLFYWKKFEKYMIFYTMPWSRWNRTHKLWNTCVVPFAIDQLGQMFWCSTHTKIWTRQQLYHCTQRLNHEDISMLCLLTPLTVIKDVKIVKNQDVMSMSMSLTVRCQNLIGSYTSTHSSFNLIGPRNKYPNIQIYKDTYQAHTFKPLTDELFIAQKWASSEGQSQDRPQGAYFSSSFRRKNRKYPTRGTLRQFSENICSEDDLRSRIFETFVIKFLACLPLLEFSNI